MRRKKKESPPIEKIYNKVSTLLVPDYILKDFDIFDVHQHTSYCVIEMYEKEARIQAIQDCCLHQAILANDCIHSETFNFLLLLTSICKLYTF